MAVWKSVFLHEFLDGNPLNFHAVSGELHVIPGGPVIVPPPDADDRGFPISPGTSLDFRLEAPLNDVIGFDLSIDLLFPLQPGVQDFPLVSLGDGQVILSMGHLDIDPGFTPETGQCRIGLRVGSRLVEFNDLIVQHRRTTRFRVRWHTLGQAQIFHDGVLRAYEPACAPGASFSLDRLIVGGFPSGPPTLSPKFLARRVYLKVVRRHDAQNELDQHVPIDTYLLPRSPCAVTVRALQDDLGVETRKFMTEIMLKLTSPWQEGQAGGPFSPQAVAAQDAAAAAVRAFGGFLDRRDPADADAFLRHIGEFLDVVAGADPARYAQLVTELSNRAQTLDPYCRETLKPVYVANAKTLDPVRRLLEAAWTRAMTARAGGAHG